MLAGMDLSLWPRVRKLFVDWGYRGLKETASSLGLELEVVAERCRVLAQDPETIRRHTLFHWWPRTKVLA